MLIRLSTLGWLVFVVTPTRATPQALAPQIVEQINAATRVRVRLVTGNRGTLYAPRADSAVLAFDRSAFFNSGGSVVVLPPPLAIARVAQIDVPDGSHAGHGAKIGAGIGAGVALLAVAACSGSICGVTAGEAVGAVAVWSVIGAGLGAVFGSGSPRWRTIYRP